MKKSWKRQIYFDNEVNKNKSDIEKIGPNEYTYPYLTQLGSFGHEYNEPGYHHERVNISKFLYCYTLNGSATLTYQGTNYKIKKGDFFLIDLMEPSIISSPNDIWEIVFMHVESGISQQIHDSIMLEKGVVNENFDPTNFIRLINRMLKLRKGHKLDQFEISNLTNQIMMDVLAQSKNEKAILNPTLKKAVEYINKEYSNGISLSDVCKNIGVTNSYLSRLFRKHFQISPLEYLFNLKSKKASILLVRTKLSYEEIARQCGFKDGNNLYNFFKKYHGRTPTEFRQRGIITNIVPSK